MYTGVYLTAREAVIGLSGIFAREEDSTLYQPVTVRGMGTRELMHTSITILHPDKRFLGLNGRRGNPFARIAETLWMLAGRDDLDWLETYIPQAKKWSDDGKTWRAAYGPRLRRWPKFVPVEYDDDGMRVNYNVDQLMEVYNKLKKDPETRQAVISIWDPAKDWVEGSRDYPCNNWLHFMIRNNKLHLVVGVRSNDLIYGFSHIDFFGWSVMQSLLASWLGVNVGHMTWVASSMHVYERHYQMCKTLAKDNKPLNFTFDAEVVDIPADVFDMTLNHTFHYADEATMLRLQQDEFVGPGMINIYKRALVLYKYWLQEKEFYNNPDTRLADRVDLVKELARELAKWPNVAITYDCIMYFADRIPGFTELPELGRYSEEFAYM